ncbi:hypothetical protein AHF37_11253 [Paragonimus kellicotti]|nr:hypothetical protein AHF37_11253 [Paragonimus kellicotti]
MYTNIRLRVYLYFGGGRRATDIGRIPILVGGTHYYLEAILWSDFLAACTSNNEEGQSMNLQGEACGSVDELAF